METLHYRSDGAAETSSGLFAVIPVIRSGEHDGMAWFEYKTSPLADTIRLEWPASTDVVLLDSDHARMLVRAGYATGLTKSQVEAFNAAVAEFEKESGGMFDPTKTVVTEPTPPALSDTLSTISSTAPGATQEGVTEDNLSLVHDAGVQGDGNASAPVSAPVPSPLDASGATGDNTQANGGPVIPVKPGKK